MRSSRVWMRPFRAWMRSSRMWMRSSQVWIRSSRVWMRSSRVWMRSSRVVRAPGCQCLSHNSPAFDPCSILQHSGIWGAAEEAVYKKSPLWITYTVTKTSDVVASLQSESEKKPIMLPNTEKLFPVWNTGHCLRKPDTQIRCCNITVNFETAASQHGLSTYEFKHSFLRKTIIFN